MSTLVYQSNSLEASSAIACREWSNHRISTRHDEKIDFRFRNLRVSDSLMLSNVAYGADVQVDPGDRAEVLLFQMPVAGGASARYGSRQVSMNTASYGLVDVRRLSQANYSADFSGRILRVKFSKLQTHLEQLLGHSVREELIFSDAAISGSEAWHQWSPFVGLIDGMLAAPETDTSTRLLASIEDTLLTGLLYSQQHNYRNALHGARQSIVPRHVKRAEEYIHAHAQKALTTAMIAKHVNVSVRALFSGFQTFRGESPSDYARNVRLDYARNDLLTGSMNVSAVAEKWGFSHMGNFATHYRKRFGELPAATMRYRRS